MNRSYLLSSGLTPRSLLEKKDADAANNLGVIYRDALGATQDLEVAYALFTQAAAWARNDDVLGRSQRNLAKILQYMTKEQVARGQAIKAGDLTAGKLREHVSPVRAARQMVVLLPVGWQAKVRTTVQGRLSGPAAKRDLKVLGIRDDEYGDMPDTLTFTTKNVANVADFLTQDIYSNRESRICLQVPYLATGRITLHQSKLPGTAGFMLRISDGKVDEIAPWNIDAGAWHGMVIATHLPADWIGRETETFNILVRMLENHVSNVASNQTAVTVLTSPQGKVCQAIVLNQITSPLYPQADARVSPVAEGLQTIGISRMMCRSNVIVHLALIIPKSKEMRAADFVEFVQAQMDDFQLRVSLLP